MDEEEIESEISVPFSSYDYEELSLKLVIKKSGEVEATVKKVDGSVVAGATLVPEPPQSSGE
jgi:hypothetical protein